jgi:ComF family protein
MTKADEDATSAREGAHFPRFAAGLKASGRMFLDLLAPPLCPLTQTHVAAPGLLSADGWSRLAFIDDPVCARCGAPFEFDHGPGAQCAGCIADPPAFDAARAAVHYDDAAHDLIVAFKHSDRTDLAPLLSGWLMRAGAHWLGGDAVIVPVPLHWRRLFKRRYNQSALLALRLSGTTGAPALLDALVRSRPTPAQQGLSADARRRNLQGAIVVSEARGPAIAGRRVIMIDDVLTTGATLSSCARALKRAGAREVFGLVLARVARDGVTTI